MKKVKIFIVFLFFSVFASMTVQAGEGTAAALILGVPTGLNFKAWVIPTTAVNVNFGFNPLNNWTYMNFDVLYHFSVFYHAPLYVGGGIKVEINGATKSTDNINSGFRMIAGDEIFLGSSFSLFAEGGYVFQFYPFTLQPGYNASIGIRYYLTHS